MLATPPELTPYYSHIHHYVCVCVFLRVRKQKKVRYSSFKSFEIFLFTDFEENSSPSTKLYFSESDADTCMR